MFKSLIDKVRGFRTWLWGLVSLSIIPLFMDPSFQAALSAVIPKEYQPYTALGGVVVGFLALRHVTTGPVGYKPQP